MYRFPMVWVIGVLGVGGLLSHLVVAQPAPPPQAPSGPVAAEMKMLQGTWQVTRFIDSSEKPAPAEETASFTFEFRENMLTMRKDRQILGGGDPFLYRIDPQKNPPAIDVYFTGDVKQPTPGIYKISGNELTICIVAGMRDGKPTSRPTEFRPSQRDLHSLFVLQKADDQKPARANVFVHPQKVTARDRLVDGPVDQAHAIEIDGEATLVWIDLAPDYRFAHATEYILITPRGSRSYKGSWWPVLNGKPLFRDTKPYKVDFPFQLQKE